MKIVFMGTTDFSVPILKSLANHHEITLVVTQPDRPFGRKQVLKPSPVKMAAIHLGLPIFQPEKIKQDHQSILDAAPDVIIVAAYGQMIPKVLLNLPRFGCINVHASLLPKYRGGSPMHTAIKNGDKETGVTIMYMALKMDAGDLLDQASIPIEATDNVGTIESKLSVLGSSLLLETLLKVENHTAIPIPQDETKVTFAWNIKPEEEALNFDQSAKDIVDHVRAFNPWPVAHLTVDDQIIKVLEARVSEHTVASNIPNGTVVAIQKGEVHIKVESGAIVLKTIQPAGRTPMDIQAYMNGAGKSVFSVGKRLK